MNHGAQDRISGSTATPLYRWRIERNLSQAQAARLLEVPLRTYRRRECSHAVAAPQGSPR